MTPLVGDPCSGGLNKSKDQEFLLALFFGLTALEQARLILYFGDYSLRS